MSKVKEQNSDMWGQVQPCHRHISSVQGCTIVLDMAEDLPQHHSSLMEVLPRDMAVRDLERQQVLMMGDIFSWL